MRANFEDVQDALADAIENEPNALVRMRLQRQFELNDYKLSWQGADPRTIDKQELREVCNQPEYNDTIIDKYRARVKNPATSIRAYCVMCMGGSVSLVKDCSELTCPLWNFRMGKDPLRGYALPPYLEPLATEEEAEEDDELFVEDDDEDDEDAEV